MDNMNKTTEDLQLRRKYENEMIHYRNIIWENNLRLVVSVVRSYLAYDNRELFMDLVQEGNNSLLKALEKFDPDKGVKFSSYSTWWMRQYINDYLYRKNPMITRTITRVGKSLLTKVRSQLEQELQREPEMDEIIEEMNKHVTNENFYSADMVQDHVHVSSELLCSEGDHTEDDPYGNNIRLFNGLTCSYNESEKTLAQDDVRKMMHAYLDRLSEKERRSLCMLYGIGMDRTYSLEEIGQMEDKTREAIRVRCEKAKAKIRKMIEEENEGGEI